MTETEDDQMTSTAKRMLSMYGRSKYTPEQRATDHAFAYDRHEQGRKFWIGVLQAMYRIKEGVNQ